MVKKRNKCRISIRDTKICFIFKSIQEKRPYKDYKKILRRKLQSCGFVNERFVDYEITFRMKKMELEEGTNFVHKIPITDIYIVLRNDWNFCAIAKDQEGFKKSVTLYYNEIIDQLKKMRQNSKVLSVCV